MMFRLFESGVLAARAQIVLVLAIGTALSLARMGDSRVGSLAQTIGDPAVLKWIFLGVAAIAATGFQPSLSRTARRLSHETQRISAGRARRVRIDLLLTLRLATAAMAILTITPPPKLLVGAFDPLLDARLTCWAWAGTMSVGAAYFGAGAAAARRALRG
jgi:hypothetical protein